MTATPATPEPLSAAWCATHFDHLAPEVGEHLHETFAHLRSHCPVVHSGQHGGFWTVSRHQDVLRVAQDWSAFSSERGITVPGGIPAIPAIPEMLDPPRHREFKRLINAHFTPAKVLEQEPAVRTLVDQMIDRFIESGTSEFMADVARPLPGLVFFDMFLHAPPEELEEINRLATIASTPTTREAREARGQMLRWIGEFVQRRREEGPRGDVVDAIIGAEVEGEPVTEDEIVGTIQLLLFGGLDTTAGALGMMMIRFCRQPEIPALLRERPDLIPAAVEELLRLDGPFVMIARTATCPADIGGHTVEAGDKVLLSWASANRDEEEFEHPDAFDLDRASNRHLAFGAGPHRCAGSNLARMNLRVAVEALTSRLDDLRLQDGAEPIEFDSAYSRTPVAVPVAFTPGPRLGA